MFLVCKKLKWQCLFGDPPTWLRFSFCFPRKQTNQVYPHSDDSPRTCAASPACCVPALDFLLTCSGRRGGKNRGDVSPWKFAAMLSFFFAQCYFGSALACGRDLNAARTSLEDGGVAHFGHCSLCRQTAESYLSTRSYDV